MKVLTFTGIFRKEGKEYSAFCPEFEVASCGGSIEEAQKNLTEAVELYLESAKDLGILPDILEEAGFEENKSVTASERYMAQITTQITGV